MYIVIFNVLFTIFSNIYIVGSIPNKNCFINIYRYIDIKIYRYTERLFEVAIKGRTEWKYNPKPVCSVHTLQPTQVSSPAFRFHTKPTLYSYSNFIICSFSGFILAFSLVSRHIYFNRNFREVIT